MTHAGLKKKPLQMRSDQLRISPKDFETSVTESVFTTIKFLTLDLQYSSPPLDGNGGLVN